MKKGIVGVLICLTLFLVIGYFEINNKDNTILKNTKMVTKQNTSMLSLMLETAEGSGDYAPSTDGTWPSSGYIFNERLSKCENDSDITWDNTTRTVKFNGNVSDKCYVYFDVAPIYPRYWNDGFSLNDHAYPNTPSTTYGSVAALRDGYGTANFDRRPIYIKTTATEHQACLYYNLAPYNKEFCMSNNYWVEGDSDGSRTKAKLKADMESTLGVTINLDMDCESDSSHAECYADGLRCNADSDGYVYCDVGYVCGVAGDGTAGCT